MSPHFEILRAEIETKISALIIDLSAGKISNEQFNLIYRRYQYSLALAEQMTDGNASEFNVFNTRDLLQGSQAQPIGLSLYHHASGTTVEMVGQFDLPSKITAPVLNDLSPFVEWQTFTEPRITKLSSELWVAFMPRLYTTLMVLFRNEPSRIQVHQMERVHHDFEELNKGLLMHRNVNPVQLSWPFTGIIPECPSAVVMMRSFQ